MSEKEVQPNLVETLVQLVQTFATIVSDSFRLAVLEAKVAGKSLVIISWLLLVMAVLGVSTWFCLLGAFAFWLFTLFSDWGIALLGAAGINILLALITIRAIVRFRKNLSFPETRKQFKFSKEQEKV